MKKPEHIFLCFALLYGIILVFLVPPLGGNDEGFQYQRIATIAYNQPFNKAVEVASGIGQFIDAGSHFFREDSKPPFGYTKSEWEKMNAIALTAEETTTLIPSYFTFHHPFSYIPQIIAFKLGILLALKPLYILYLCKIANLLANILLIFCAIKIMPSYKYFMAALALLPCAFFYHGAINADGFTNALAFLFCAFLFREITSKHLISQRSIVMICLLGFLLAQCKNAYLPLLFLALSIPKERFISTSHHSIALALSIIPAMLCSIAWIIVSKQRFFTGLSYHTWGGDANPDQQINFILHNPLEFLAILWHTVCCTSLIPLGFLEIFRDVGPGYLLPIAVAMALVYCLIAIVISETSAICYNGNMRIWAALLGCASFGLIMMFLYVHWTGVGLSKIIGFHGRYLCPLLPLLIPFFNHSRAIEMSLRQESYLILLAVIGLNAEIVQILYNYY